MTTDFTYNNQTIDISGPAKPSGVNQPLDPRTEVKIYADIKSIPNPYIGMIITVLEDETNSNKMTDYKVLSLKANSLGVANSVVDQVQRYVDYLGANGQGVDTNNFATKEELGLKADKTELHSHINKTVLDGITSTNVDNWNNKVDKVEGKILTTNDYTNEEKQTVASLKATVGDTSSGLVKDVKDLKTNGVSQDNINSAIENYLQEHPVSSGATAEQAAQIQANKTAIGDETGGLIKEINDLTESLSNIDAVSLNGKSFSEPMTKDEYDAIMNKNPNTIYLVNDEQVINSVPDYSTSDANKVLAVNSTGTALAWVDAPSGSGTGITAAQAAQIQANKTAIQTINETIGNKNELPVGDANIIASINRIDSKTSTGGTGLTSEQEAKLNSIDNKVDKINGKGLSTNDYTTEEKATLSNLKTTVGDNSSGLVKDVKDLKTNGVSQDNINTAVENYLSNNSIENGLIFTGTAETGRIIEETLDETVIKQQYLGGYIEIQPDSWDGEICATDDTTKTWGFPYSLIPTERNRAKEMLLHGKGTNIMYIRFPLGFAYRGFRNIDETSRLAKNIGERFKGQNKTLRELFKDISSVGGGLAPEYWCPPPYWLTSGSYNGGNELCAGGSYSRTTKLSSIKTTDPTQYSKQINDFADAVVNDLEYLHQNIAPVRMFGLQNEPLYSTLPYGACKYDAQTYNDVLEVLYPKIQASAILSEYEDEPNEVKLLVASSDEPAPFDGIGATFIQNHSDMIWGYTHHSMRKASGENGNGAEWYKSDEYKTTIKSDRTNVFINEYEYFTSDKTDEFRCGNNMLRLIFELIYGEAQVLHPVIHMFKPIGQTLSGTNTRGYCLLQCNLNGEYGYDLSSDVTLNKGTFSENKSMFNSWGLFGDNLPIGSYVIGNYNQTQKSLGWCALKFNNKLYIFMANSGVSTNGIIKLTFSETKKFSGKCYSMNYYGEKMASKSGSTIEFLIPPSTGIVWIEQESNNIEEPSDPTTYGNIVISNSSVSIDENSTDTFTVKLDKAPTNNQTVNISVNNAYTTINKTSLTFTPSNYSREQTVTITGTHLNTDYSNKNSIITLSSPNVSSKTINVTITNIDIEPMLDNITAVYTQGNTKIYPDTSLDSLKSNLIVTANYTDGSNSQVTNYILSGTLTEGTSTITVTYNEKSTTFNVIVSAVSDIDYSEGYINDSGNLAYLKGNYADNKYININSASNVIIYTTTGGITCFRLAEYDENKNFIKRSYKATNNLIKATSDEFILDTNTKYIRVGFGMPEPVTEEMLNKLFGEYTINNEIAPNNLLYEEGTINSTTGLNEDSAEKYRTDYVELCCNYVSVNTGIVNPDLRCTIRFYDKEKNILSNVTSGNIYVVDNLKYIRLVLINSKGGKVTINENDAVLINGLKYVLEKQ